MSYHCYSTCVFVNTLKRRLYCGICEQSKTFSATRGAPIVYRNSIKREISEFMAEHLHPIPEDVIESEFPQVLSN